MNENAEKESDLREARLIASGVVDANGNLKPYTSSGHKSEPLTAEELDDE